MKNLVKWLILVLTTVFTLDETQAQVTYTIDAVLNLNKAQHFGDKDHGITVRDEIDNSADYDITVEVVSNNNAYFTYASRCDLPAVNGHTSPLVMYKTARTDNSNGEYYDYVHDWSGSNYNYYQRCLVGLWTQYNTKPDERKFRVGQARTAYYFLYQNPSKWALVKHIDVQVKLTLSGDIKLSDVGIVKIPGVSPLNYYDFVNKGLSDNYGCAGSNSTICNLTESIVNIPTADLNVMKPIIQVHRGIWGEIGGFQENTIGAFTTAVNQDIIY